MFGYNLRLNVNDHVWNNSKELYSFERHKIIDKYRDGCTRVPCCRKDNSGLKNSSWPLPIFLIWSNGIYVNHVMCFKTEDESYRWLIQWIEEEKKKFCGKWNFPHLHVHNVFGDDVSSFLHPIFDDGEFVPIITDGHVTNTNFWNGGTMENWQKHEFFETDAVNSIDVMEHWSRVETYANEFIEKFYGKPFPSSWRVDLKMSDEVSI